jgi:hypothetical protein
MCELGCRDLQTRHRAGIKRAQDADRGVGQRKLRLQDREQQIERVGQAIMQRVGAASDPERAPSAANSSVLRPVAVEKAVVVMTGFSHHDDFMTNDLS